jgi:hypothetical protein
MRLDFLVPGFANCRTMTLCALLAEHPQVLMPERKDFRLFDLPDYERRWEESHERDDLGEMLAAFPSMIDDTASDIRLDNYRKDDRTEQILVVLLEDLQADPERDGLYESCG